MQKRRIVLKFTLSNKETDENVVALGELLIDFTENGVSEQGNPILEAKPGADMMLTKDEIMEESGQSQRSITDADVCRHCRNRNKCYKGINERWLHKNSVVAIKTTTL